MQGMFGPTRELRRRPLLNKKTAKCSYAHLRHGPHPSQQCTK